MTAAPLRTVAEIRAIEAAFATGPNSAGPDSLMLRAGAAAARQAVEMLAGNPRASGRVLVLAGPGNNGGDAWVAARALQESWHRVTVLDCATGPPQAPEARAARDAFISGGGLAIASWPFAATFDLIVDGLLGIGIARPVQGTLAALIVSANDSGIPILAIDIPSGLDADSGAIQGSAIRAARTLTFLGLKPGLFTGDGPDCAGTVVCDLLGIDGAVLPPTANTLLAARDVRVLVPHRPHNSNKGSFGTVAVVAGATGMLGAGVLAARAALLLGAGKVFFAPLAEDAPPYDTPHPEIMMTRPRELQAKEPDVIVIGPGMGTGDAAKNILVAVLKTGLPLVVDADALNLVAAGRALQNALAKRDAPALLTPHPGEAARLLDCTIADVQRDRIGAAGRLVARFGHSVILKGAGSIVATRGGAWHVCAHGSPGMASGGMGDALAGMLGALLAQGLDADAAAMLGVVLHAAAGESLETSGMQAGMTASELIPVARRLLYEWSR